MDISVVGAGSGRSISLGPSAQLDVKEDGSHTRGNLMVAEREMVIQLDFAAPLQHLHRGRGSRVEVAEAMGRVGRAEVELTAEKLAQLTSQIMAKYQTDVVDPVAWERDHPGHTC